MCIIYIEGKTKPYKLIKEVLNMTMTNQELQEKCKEYREYKRLADEAQAVMDSISDQIKSYMIESGQEKLIAGEYKVNYTDCKRTDIDKKALQAEQTEIYNAYLKETFYKRFAIA
jgi:predicted phage-related endonuclease